MFAMTRKFLALLKADKAPPVKLEPVKRKDTDLGMTAVMMGLLTATDVEAARAHQMAHCPEKRFGDVLLETGKLDEDKLRRVLDKQEALRSPDSIRAVHAAQDTAEMHINDLLKT